MKNIKWTRVAGGLLVLTLATSCFVGSTLAKYVSQGKGQDGARVAKWGVEIGVTGNGFHKTYGKNDVNATIPGDDSSISVKSDINVVAPGTKGTFGGVTITGTPEVAVKIETTADVELSGWNIADDGEFYCPLKFTIGDTIINGLDYSADNHGGEGSFESAIKTAIQNATSKTIPAGTDLSDVGDGITYSWEWPFTGGSGSAASQSDVLDTLLGDYAADDDDSNDPQISITVTTTVTQVD